MTVVISGAMATKAPGVVTATTESPIAGARGGDVVTPDVTPDAPDTVTEPASDIF